MKKGKTKNYTKRQQLLLEMVAKFPEARLVKNKYVTMAKMMRHLRPELNISESLLTEIAYDFIQADREWRRYTEDYDRANKIRLEQEKILELGYQQGLPKIYE